MTKPILFTYLNNLIAYSIFSLLKIILPKKNYSSGKSILFINSGQIGDLIVSSILFDNEEFLFREYTKIILLVKDDYQELFVAYHGKFLIEFYNYRKYKWNIFYKIKLLIKLRSVGFRYCFNLTAARGILNDEMAILSGAEETLALNSDWKYLKKIFGKRMDSLYKEIIGKDHINEYEKHFTVLNYLVKSPVLSFTSRGNNLFFDLNNLNRRIVEPITQKEKLIVVAPYSSELNRDWPIEKYNPLIGLLINDGFKIILLGSKSQKRKLELFNVSNNEVVVLAGKLKLHEIPTLLNLATLFIGLDSGLTHIALRLNIPTVAIIGGGMHGKFLPAPFISENIKYLSAGCEYFLCEWKCKYHVQKCVADIQTDVVYASILTLLKKD
ncbi:MAG: glycosyltransferase family 9 protein [Ignavibacteriaceae bacterium]|jgi:ADP-heptose:LPS heptosyltransferase